MTNMTQTKPIVSIENVVASASVDQAIDLADLTKKFPDTEWHPDQFPGLVFRLPSPKIKIKKDAVIKVQNIVASGILGGKIHLEQAARKLPRSMYEPEQFPGLIHRMVDPKTVLLLFASGKLVCTGAKKESDVYKSVHNIHALLEEKNLMIYDA